MALSVWVKPFSAVYSGDVTLAERLTAWIEFTGKQQNVIADRGGLKPSQVSDIALGKVDPRWSSVEKIAKGLGVSLAEFLDGPPRPEEDAGHGEGPQREAFAILAQLVADVDATTQGDNTWRGDIFRAIAVLHRALQRADDTRATGGASPAVGR